MGTRLVLIKHDGTREELDSLDGIEVVNKAYLVGGGSPELFIPHHNCKCAIVEEKEMVNTHGVFKLYGLNKRTGAFMEKTIFGKLEDQEAVINAAILENSDEIKLMLGDKPEELQYQLDCVMSYAPIEDK